MPVDSLSQVPMEQIVAVFGITFEQIATVTAIVFVVVTYLKGEFPKIKGNITRGISLGLSFAVSFYLAEPEWIKIIALTIAAFISPAAGHMVVKRIANGVSGRGTDRS